VVVDRRPRRPSLRSDPCNGSSISVATGMAILVAALSLVSFPVACRHRSTGTAARGARVLGSPAHRLTSLRLLARCGSTGRKRAGAAGRVRSRIQ